MVYGRRIGWLCLALVFGGCAKAPESREPAALAGIEPVQEWLAGSAEPRETARPQVGPQAPPVADMIVGLVDKLERNPDDRAGWELLAKSYAFVGDLQQARAASERAVELGADARELGINATDNQPRPN